MSFKKTLLIAIGAAMTACAASAEEMQALPEGYEGATREYVESRLDNPRAARVKIVGQPYEVEADFDDAGTYRGWAVDVRVRSKMRTRGSGVAPETVIFIDGRPVALESDIEDMDEI